MQSYIYNSMMSIYPASEMEIGIEDYRYNDPPQDLHVWCQGERDTEIEIDVEVKIPEKIKKLILNDKSW